MQEQRDLHLRAMLRHNLLKDNNFIASKRQFRLPDLVCQSLEIPDEIHTITESG